MQDILHAYFYINREREREKNQKINIHTSKHIKKYSEGNIEKKEKCAIPTSLVNKITKDVEN